MYDMKGFGARIAEMRKAKNMTQEELAERLGLTSQAVSKWENDLSYPDITLIPTLCTIFGASLDDIFGKTQKDFSGLGFPQVFKGFNLAATFANIACYSDKEVEESGGSTVRFKDGSIAELQSRRVVNRGDGRILLKTLDESFMSEHSITNSGGGENGNFFKKIILGGGRADTNEMSLIKKEYGDVSELVCAVPGAFCEINRADGEVTEVLVAGYADFVDLLKFSYDGALLNLDYDRDKWEKIDKNRWDIKKNTIKINLSSKLPQLTGIKLSLHGSGQIMLGVPSDKFEAAIHGSGNISAENINFGNAAANIHGSGNISFGNADNTAVNIHGSGNVSFGNAAAVSANIHGSGNINFGDAAAVNANIHGSGNVKFKDAAGEVNTNIHGSGNTEFNRCAGLKLSIHGSGDLDAGEVSEKIDISIHGSGEVNIKKGEVENFEVQLNSSGKINAGGVTANYAKIKIPNRGRVELGRVKTESVEICGDKAELIIHKRG